MDVMDSDSIDAGRGLERELTLMARHTALVSQWRMPDRALDRSAYLLLSRLEIGEPMTLRELSEAFGLDVSTVNRQTAALVRQGLAERIADADGGTARRLRPTERGLAALRSDRDQNVEGVTSLVSDWDDQDRRDLVTLLRKLNEKIEERQGLNWPRD